MSFVDLASDNVACSMDSYRRCDVLLGRACIGNAVTARLPSACDRSPVQAGSLVVDPPFFGVDGMNYADKGKVQVDVPTAGYKAPGVDSRLLIASLVAFGEILSRGLSYSIGETWK